MLDALEGEERENDSREAREGINISHDEEVPPDRAERRRIAQDTPEVRGGPLLTVRAVVGK